MNSVNEKKTVFSAVKIFPTVEANKRNFSKLL
jgi:hypothetical protein